MGFLNTSESFYIARPLSLGWVCAKVSVNHFLYPNKAGGGEGDDAEGQGDLLCPAESQQLGSATVCQAVCGSGGVSRASARLPATAGSPRDGAGRGFKASCSFHVSGPGTLSCVQQPKEAGIKEGEKVWVSDMDSWGQNESNGIPFGLLSWHRPSPAGSSEDRGFSSRLRVNPCLCKGRECRVLQMPDSPNAELLNALISLNIAHPNI